VRIFITGGTGLVGSHAIERLAGAGHEVKAMVRSESGERLVKSLGAEPVRGAVEDRLSWSAATGAQAIIHAAALVTTQATWERYSKVNVDAVRSAAETAAAQDARLIHVSSVAVYGRQPLPNERSLVTEDVEYAPIAKADYYARSKRQAEETLWEVAGRLGVSALAIRPCVIYGERERLFMARLLRILRFGVAPLVGPGDNRLAMVYVGNVIDAIASALERPETSGPFNTASDGGITQCEFYKIIEEETGHRIRMVRVPLAAAAAFGTAWHLAARLRRPGRYAGLGSSSARFLARENPYSSRRAESELGWIPSTPPREALRRTVRWFAEEVRG
jgi:nucleoside-diphosphate-sugar epimerase